VILENVICDARITEKLQSGAIATRNCDGTLLPVQRVLNGTVTVQIWVCSQCAREVK